MKYFSYLFSSLFFWAATSFSFHNEAHERFINLVNEEREEIRNFLTHNIYTHSAENALAVNPSTTVQTWLEPTPSQGPGPFYPVKFPDDVDTDLTKIHNGQQAKGVTVYIQGQITDQQGNSIEDANIEIWQASASGRYNHPGDSNTDAEIDINFQDYGVT